VENITNMLAAFPPVSKQQWLTQIEKDLKGKPLADLYWSPMPGVTTDPFAHHEDRDASVLPLVAGPIRWAISEDIRVQDSAAANAQALEALQLGVEALQFELSDASVHWPVLLADIYLDYIGLYFNGPGMAQQPAAVLAALQGIASERGINTHALNGALMYDPVGTSALQDWRYVQDLMAFAKTEFPGFRVLNVDGLTACKDTQSTVDELVDVLKKVNIYVTELTRRGSDAAVVLEQIQCTLAVGSSYFVSLAKLRAFRLLWYHLCQSWHLPPTEPVVEVRFAPSAYTDDLYTNMIRATTMAMSAVLGGAQRLTVSPYDAGREALAKYPPAFGRRIARNVQHLLKLESYLDQTTDPAAGSYYIEHLTRQIAEKAWEAFLVE
jgi:methylmalonyl-CoA mutase